MSYNCEIKMNGDTKTLNILSSALENLKEANISINGNELTADSEKTAQALFLILQKNTH